MYIKILKIYEKVQDIILENSDLIEIVRGYCENWASDNYDSSAVVTLMERIKQNQDHLLDTIDECDAQLYDLLQENAVL